MKYIISKILLIAIIGVISASASGTENTKIDVKMDKLENILRIHEGVISGLMDDKAEKKELKKINSELSKMDKNIKSILLVINASKTKEIDKSEVLYDSKYDKKFKSYLNKRKQQ